MLQDKNFTTFAQQISKLESRGLSFVSKEMALATLRRYGYYNVINGYKAPFVEKEGDDERYKEGITFEHIFALYELDRKLRNAVLNSLLEVEDTLRTATAHCIAEKFTAEESKYLDRVNYRLGKKRSNGTYQLDDMLSKFQKIRNDNVQPIQYYREHYGNIPPWILLKGASFGNLVNFIKLQKGDVKTEIISIIYDMSPAVIANSPALRDLFMDTIFVCLDYRNKAAHGGRIYNYQGDATFRYNPILHTATRTSPADYRKGKGHSGLFHLICSLSLWDNKHPELELKDSIISGVSDYCKMYPEDQGFLIDLMRSPHNDI